MPSSAIVEHLDALKQALFGFLFRVLVLVINQICFQRTEEALRNRVLIIPSDEGNLVLGRHGR